jgi:hypothetical protein
MRFAYARPVRAIAANVLRPGSITRVRPKVSSRRAEPRARRSPPRPRRLQDAHPSAISRLSHRPRSCRSSDEDVFDPQAYVGQTHVTAPERAALAELQALGLRDVVRDRWPGKRVFTYWDYRAGMFHRDLGMRIDLILAGAPVAARVRAAWIDRLARKGKGPSDHAPVIVDLDEAPDGDVGPVVPPPLAPVTKRGAAKLPQSP